MALESASRSVDVAGPPESVLLVRGAGAPPPPGSSLKDDDRDINTVLLHDVTHDGYVVSADAVTPFDIFVDRPGRDTIDIGDGRRRLAPGEVDVGVPGGDLQRRGRGAAENGGASNRGREAGRPIYGEAIGRYHVSDRESPFWARPLALMRLCSARSKASALNVTPSSNAFQTCLTCKWLKLLYCSSTALAPGL